MSTLGPERTLTPAADWRVLLIGLGGLGCPAALALVRAGVGLLKLCDDDQVDEGNLHRQILYGPDDVGSDKLSAAARALEPMANRSGTRIELVRSRFLPENARELARGVDLVIEGADNFATKFLTADACHLERRPVVHGAGLRWVGTAWSVAAAGRPCYRCLFEDLPSGPQANCDSAGVMGPVVGIVGALMAELCLRSLSSGGRRSELWTLDGKTDTLRPVPVTPRADCPLCGNEPRIREIDEARYLAEAGALA
ncbi:MAG TPA: HesA/MoeB/ThiF family protein [Polyangiaceae bacterium]|nr:HesA/MoeB/ThiF family protein [Polyangiaceae bacterium]